MSRWISLGPARDLARGPLPRGPALGRAGEHGVLGRDPARPGVLEERRDPLVDRGRGDDPGLAHLDQGRPVGELDVVRLDADRAQFVGSALSRSGAGGPDSSGGLGLVVMFVLRPRAPAVVEPEPGSGSSRISVSIILVQMPVIFNTFASTSSPGRRDRGQDEEAVGPAAAGGQNTGRSGRPSAGGTRPGPASSRPGGRRNPRRRLPIHLPRFQDLHQGRRNTRWCVCWPCSSARRSCRSRRPSG